MTPQPINSSAGASAPTEHRRAGEDGMNEIEEPDQTSKSTAARNGAGNTGVTAGETASTPYPDYIAQVHQSTGLHREWWRNMTADARNEGCTFFRVSVHPMDEGLTLFEAWKVPPADQGDIRWQLIPAPPLYTKQGEE